MKKDFLIYGGDLVNKGAQAMTYISVYEIKKKFPDANVTLLSYKDAKRKNLDRDNLLFDIRSMTLQTMLYHLGGIYRLLSGLISLKKHTKPDKELAKKLSLSVCMINISGFALSSKWGFVGPMSYLLSIKLMQKYGVKVILMPQSFGPFKFKGIKKKIFDSYAKKILPYAEKIFAREKEGYEYLVENYGLTNVSLSADMVLQNKSVDYHLVLKNFDVSLPYVPENSVAIIPNIRSMENSKINLIDIYQKIVQSYIDRKIPVTILSHSNEDIEICRQIKERFVNEPTVVYIDKELTCYEYEQLSEKFRYIIAARFHSIVHAYKQGIPCIALGWAVKYRELMALFSQEKYAVDVSVLNDEAEIMEMIGQMETNLDEDKVLIQKGLEKIQQENCFSVLERVES